MSKVYSVLDRLPDDEQIVRAYGHKTFCCAIDMDDEPKWHMAHFKLCVNAYRLKNRLPDDPEASILEDCEVMELWLVEDDAQLLKVTHWESLPEVNEGERA